MTALELAIKWHKNQVRKGERNGYHLPFIVHPISVMKRVWEWGFATPITMDASATHDTKEDTDITWEELMGVIGEEAADIVFELTYTGNSPEEKAEYLKSFRNKSLEALVIKLADRFQNVKDFMLTKPEYANKYFDKAKFLFQALTDRKDEFEPEAWNKINDDIEELRVTIGNKNC
jgi:(p)ppGpp synthase/HD superfamily hydrolase